jgi:hypothetical protein
LHQGLPGCFRVVFKSPSLWLAFTLLTSTKTPIWLRLRRILTIFWVSSEPSILQ